MLVRAVAALVILVFAAHAAGADLPTRGVVTGDDVYVRSGPGKSYRDVGALPKRAVIAGVNVLEIERIESVLE